MKFFTTLALAQLALTWAVPTTSVEERGEKLYVLKAVAPGQPIDGANIQLDTQALNTNGFSPLRLLSGGQEAQIYTTPGTSPNTFSLKIAPATSDPINVVLSGNFPYFQGLGAVRDSQLSNFNVRQGGFTLSKVKGNTFCVGYSTLPNSGFYAYTSDGTSYSVVLYDASSGNPPPIPAGQTLIPLKLELVKVKKSHRHG